ncbi:hypothetical protein CsatB_024096 [Cannabis sativa]
MQIKFLRNENAHTLFLITIDQKWPPLAITLPLRSVIPLFREISRLCSVQPNLVNF